jgi:hypothetical protein
VSIRDGTGIVSTRATETDHNEQRRWLRLTCDTKKSFSLRRQSVSQLAGHLIDDFAPLVLGASILHKGDKEERA